MTGLGKRIRWAVARRMHRYGLPYWWVTPRWTAAEVEEIKRRGRERYEEIRKYID